MTIAVLAGVLLAATFASQAGASQLVEFEQAAALAANGTIPPVPAKPLEEARESCGSETATWGSELLTTNPKEIKVPNEWGDIVPGKEVMVSGTIHNLSTPGDADIPVDHPFSADTTFDVMLDEPYWDLARELTAESEGKPSAHELHMELETGAFPHVLPQRQGPAEGEPWGLTEAEITEREEHGESTQSLLEDASIGLETGYIPQEGDRIAMRGRWLIDCGHNDFHGELHPITFMAFGHAEGAKTVVHVLSNAYRVTQLYGAGTAEVNGAPKGKTFPAGFEEAVTALVTNAFFGRTAPLSLLVGLEKTLPSTAPFKVCAPESASGPLKATYNFVKRGGVEIAVKHPIKSRCATITAKVNPEKYKAFQPRKRTCEMPWPGLSESIAEALGVSGVRSNEIETIRVNATGGTFTITYAGETTVPLGYNASAVEVQGALEELLAVNPGDITVSGGPGGEGGGTPYTLAFGAALAEQSVTPVTTNRLGLTGGSKLASVIVIRPGGPLDLRRFILSLIEQKQKVGFEEAGYFAAVTKTETNMALTPQTSCVDPPSAPPLNPEKHQTTDKKQAFPYYGEVQVELQLSVVRLPGGAPRGRGEGERRARRTRRC
jgi:hypothetical protein